VRKTHTETVSVCIRGQKPRKTHLLYYIYKYQAAKCDRERFFVPNNPHFWLAHKHKHTLTQNGAWILRNVWMPVRVNGWLYFIKREKRLVFRLCGDPVLRRIDAIGADVNIFDWEAFCASISLCCKNCKELKKRDESSLFVRSTENYKRLLCFEV